MSYLFDKGIKILRDFSAKCEKNDGFEEWRNSYLHDKDYSSNHQFRYSSKKKAAFTLAEVLITLGIIGVVAAITMPALINKTQMMEYKSRLKKSYSVLLQAHNLISTENGGFQYAVASCETKQHYCLKNLFKKYIKNAKDCDLNSDENNNCFVKHTQAKKLNGENAGYSFFNNDVTASLALADGTAISFYLDKPNCTFIATPTAPERCGWAVVDVNGINPPNTWGKDLYLFFIYPNFIKPAKDGEPPHFYSNDCNKDGYGLTCASEYLLK